MLPDNLIEEIQRLLPQRLAKVGELDDFLVQKECRRAAPYWLLAVAPALEAAGALPPVEAEFLAVRTARRGRPEHFCAQASTS